MSPHDDVPPSADRRPPRTGRRRWVTVAVVAAVVVAGGVTGVVLATRGDDGPATPAATGASAPLSLIPLPSKVERTSGPAFALDGTTRVVTEVDPAANAAARKATPGVGEDLAAQLRRSTGLALPTSTVTSSGASTSPAPEGSTITLRLSGPQAATWDLDAPLDDPTLERYTLDADSRGVVVTSGTPAGLFRGVQTLRQLLPASSAAPDAQPAPSGGWTVPAVRITDEPRFAYRGALLDVARRFYPVKDVERYIDDIAQYKIDALHLHLTDDQGWRIVVDGEPTLTTVGASTQSGFAPGTGGPWYYTKEQYAQIVAYAARRFITVVPEIDGPGHTLAAQASIGSLRCDGTRAKPYSGFDVGNPMVCASDANLANIRSYLRAVTRAVVAQNPGPYLHLGGDEVPDPPKGWYESYTAAANRSAAAAGKTVIAWHQWVTGAPLPQGSVMEYWGTGSDRNAWTPDNVTQLKSAVAQGAKILMAPADRTYLDMHESPIDDLGLEWAGITDVEHAYDWEPETVLADDGVDLTGHVYGVEAALWADRTYPGSLTHLPTSTDEFMPVDQYMDAKAFPRLPAIAEVAWTAQSARHPGDFKTRLVAQAPRWKAEGIGYTEVPDLDWG
ncbi:beta-N-acetylhexosaminidase [Luteimicrobium album]|uniref:beta-N-acetylhexosaminidase n=1 Tax=Luteimicrobium album TaxID=1054550 RepID=A0ABQ6HY79_9MICO|nr:family 20 glycosylhydrolase [Luteimicrobium album]GMA22515.1 beta-N-acetylhexosaminidase [Luteimicrobium album]